MQVRPDPARGLDEGDAVAVVLSIPVAMAKMLGSKMMSSGKADLIDQDVVGAPGDRGLALERVGLALLVERHHHDGGAVAAHGLGMIDEGGLALLDRDRVHHRLALQAFQPGLHHREFRGVHHHGHAGDVGLGGNQVEEGRHRGFGSSRPSSMLTSMICAPFST